jgi:hypothetical protein
MKEKTNNTWLIELAEKYPSSADPRFMEGVLEHMSLREEEGEKKGRNAAVSEIELELLQYQVVMPRDEKWTKLFLAVRSMHSASTPLTTRKKSDMNTQNTVDSEWEEGKIKDWIETCLDGDAHGEWFRAPQFVIIEDMSELMAPRIAEKVLTLITSVRSEERDLLKSKIDTILSSNESQEMQLLQIGKIFE